MTSKYYQTSSIQVISYDENEDTFLVRVQAGPNVTRTRISSIAIALIVGESNEPEQFIGNKYSIVSGI